MARTPTTFDPFNAIAEPKRRQVLDVLAERDQTVNDLVAVLGWPQPMVSKHLGVLKEVGLVMAREEGRNRIYRLNAEPLKPIFNWARSFERFWTQHLDNIKQRAERKSRDRKAKEN